MRTTNSMDVVNGAAAEEKAVGGPVGPATAAASTATKSGFVKAAGVVARSAIQINMGELLLPLSQLGDDSDDSSCSASDNDSPKPARKSRRNNRKPPPLAAIAAKNRNKNSKHINGVAAKLKKGAAAAFAASGGGGAGIPIEVLAAPSSGMSGPVPSAPALSALGDCVGRGEASPSPAMIAMSVFNTSRSAKSLKDLYAITREFNMNKCLPRWPAECQVLRNRIRHIRSVAPAGSEVFYEVSGKEPTPRPLGEDHGVVVFDYQPVGTGIMNYFSRSVAAPTSDNPEHFSDHPKLPDALCFDSRFESGNLGKAIRISESYYELYLRPDLYSDRHRQWFYFQVTNMRSDVTYRFSIVNLSKPESLYTCGMRPVLYSETEAETHYVGWSRVGHNIRYYRNCEDDDNSTYSLTFTLNFPHDNDTVYFAHCYPYTYSDLQDDLAAIQDDEVRSRYCSQRLLCRTLAGNNVYVLTVSSPNTNEEVRDGKQVVVLTARVHPGETPCSWIMRGIIDFLVGDTDVARELRARFIFKIVPMINPDGVIVGNTRCSLAGRDLNRQYKSVIKEAFPPVFHVKQMIRKLQEEGGVAFYCDLHAHSRKFNVFMYGCENRKHSEKYLREQIFPLMLHKNSAEKFSFDDCRFHIQRHKETTGRVVFWAMGIMCSYTMEASYGGSNMGSRAFTHFNTEDYEGVGRYFCETLLDHQDPCPLKDAIRLKILTRLTKDGSSAGEPANIPMTDYSSLSSAGLTSADEDDDGSKEQNQPPAAAHVKQRKKGSSKSGTRRERVVGKFGRSYKRVESYVQYGSPKMFMKKSDSERALVTQDRRDSSASTSSATRVSSAQPRAPPTAVVKKSGDRRKFKRSLTMNAIPVIVSERVDSNMIRVPPPRPSEGEGGNVPEDGPATKFTIGTSDEDDLDDDDEDESDDETMPYSPIDLTDGLMSGSAAGINSAAGSSRFDFDFDVDRRHSMHNDHLSASSCRRVQTEIMDSMNRFKTSLMSRSGSGLMLSLGEYTTSDNELSNTGDENEGGSASRLLPPTPSGILGKKPISVNLPPGLGSTATTNGSRSSSARKSTRKWRKAVADRTAATKSNNSVDQSSNSANGGGSSSSNGPKKKKKKRRASSRQPK